MIRRNSLVTIFAMLLALTGGCGKPHANGPSSTATLAASRTLLQSPAGQYPISASFSGDGKTLAIACTDKTVHLFDLSSPLQPRALQSISLLLTIRHAVLSPNGKLLAITLAPGRRPGSASEASCLRIFPVGQFTDAIEPIVLAPSASFDRMAFSTDGKTLAVGINDPPDHQRVELLAMPSGQLKVTAEFRPPSAAPASVVFSPDSRLVAVNCGRVVHLIDAAAGGDRSILIGSDQPADSIASLDFSADSKTLATLTTDGVLKLWDQASSDQKIRDNKKQERRLSPAADSPMPIAYSADGKFLAVYSPGQALLLDADSLNTAATFTGIDKSVTCFAFSPDGQGVVTTDQSGAARWWDLEKN